MGIYTIAQIHVLSLDNLHCCILGNLQEANKDNMLGLNQLKWADFLKWSSASVAACASVTIMVNTELTKSLDTV